MENIKIEERTLYPPLVNYLKSIGFNAIGESSLGSIHPDILFKKEDINFVIEVKIGDIKVGLEAVAQASKSARKLNSQNIVILIYPEQYRNQIVLDNKLVDEIALNKKIKILTLTEYWTESLDVEAKNFFNLLNNKFKEKIIKVDFKTIVNLIENYVKDINSIIFQIKTEELIAEIVNQLDLFASIGDIKDKATAKKQIINLASYLLFNQILFYNIFKKKIPGNKLKELDEINSIKDLQFYIDSITDIDYKSIYRVNILGHIPENMTVLILLNQLIQAIKLLRAEYITDDLAGRFFHDLIPFEVRKVLAAFYTHPVAADILASLLIDSFDETIIDPACGSGTLLVSAYKRKQELYEQLYGFKNLKNMHKTFIESDITGIDLMPFASHITTINLTMQNIEQETNIVRIAAQDSLDLVTGILDETKFKTRGVKITPYTETIQDSLFGASGQKVSEGAISLEGRGEDSFIIKPVDIVIMNPPFSDREKMPLKMREKLKKNLLGEIICGHQVNLWGYFLALADKLIKAGGKIGAIIPMNFARGKATERIREYIINNLKINYILKPVGELAFSEGSAFKDIIIILNKNIPKDNEKTKIVFLKKSIRSLQVKEKEDIVHKIKEFSFKKDGYYNGYFDLAFINAIEIKNLKDNLMPILGLSSIKNVNTINNFLELFLEKARNKINKIPDNMIEEGFHASPRGLSELTFITRPFNDQRVSKSFMILDSKNLGKLDISINKAKYKFSINEKNTYPALRTLTNFDSFNIYNRNDFFVKEDFDNFNQVLTLSRFREKNKKKFDWQEIESSANNKLTHLAVARRFNPHSPNTHFFAFYSDDKFITPHTFKILKFDKEESKIQCLFLNSVLGMLDIITLREQTTGHFTDIMESDLVYFNIFNYDSLSKEDKEKLLELFNDIGDVQFPSILDQFEARFDKRLELDIKVLEILGFSKKMINEWLPKIYDVLVSELKTI